MDMNYFFTVNADANHTRSNGLKLYKSRFNSNTRKFFFLQRIINDWNSLPHDVVSAPNVFILGHAILIIRFSFPSSYFFCKK